MMFHFTLICINTLNFSFNTTPNSLKNVIPVGQFALENNIDRRKFSEYFKNEFDYTPIEYLKLKRNEKLEELLCKFMGKKMGASFFRFELGFPTTDAFYKFITRNKHKSYSIFIESYSKNNIKKESVQKSK